MTDARAEQTPHQAELQDVLNESLAEFAGLPVTEALKARIVRRVKALLTIQFQLTTKR